MPKGQLQPPWREIQQPGGGSQERFTLCILCACFVSANLRTCMAPSLSGAWGVGSCRVSGLHHDSGVNVILVLLADAPFLFYPLPRPSPSSLLVALFSQALVGYLREAERGPFIEEEYPYVHGRYRCWLSLGVSHWLVPNASLAGHVSGIAAGLLMIYLPQACEWLERLLGVIGGHAGPHGAWQGRRPCWSRGVRASQEESWGGRRCMCGARLPEVTA